MKEFRKENNKLVCEECHKLFMNVNGLAQHVNYNHDTKEYYDKWPCEENDDECAVCRNKTKFIGLGGYNNWCTRKCAFILRQICLEENNLLKYGVKNVFKSLEIKDKIKCTLLTNSGYDHNFKDPQCREKIKQTFIEKYGVPHHSQNPKIHKKQQMGGYRAKKFKDTNIYYRGFL